MTELSVHAPEILWEDGELVLYRAVPDGEPVLAAMPLTAPPSREAIARLQHAYKLRDQLDPAWAARPLRLVTERGRLTLLSEDPGGEPLLRLLGQPWEVASFLRLAIGLAAALARLHERGLIHKDIKPANVLVNKRDLGSLADRFRHRVSPPTRAPGAGIDRSDRRDARLHGARADRPHASVN
jgi:hypothetical protein